MFPTTQLHQFTTQLPLRLQKMVIKKKTAEEVSCKRVAIHGQWRALPNILFMLRVFMYF